MQWKGKHSFYLSITRPIRNWIRFCRSLSVKCIIWYLIGKWDPIWADLKGEGTKKTHLIFQLLSKKLELFAKKLLHMEQAYELHSVEQGIIYFFQNKGYGPIIPFLSTGTKRGIYQI